MSWTKSTWSLALAGVMLALSPSAWAQVFEIQLSDDDAKPRLTVAELPSYWIGIALKETDPSLLAHLKLGHGVLVGEVIPDSPAAKVGLQPHDIIVNAGDVSIKTGDDLLKAVADSQGKEIELSIVREGKLQTIKITPAKRPGDQVAPQPPKAVEGQPREAVEKALRLWKDRVGPLELDLVGPGVVVRSEPAPLPDDMKITVEREGKKPAKITVKRGDDSWGATGEKEIDTLPEVARPYARQMLGLPNDRLWAFGERATGKDPQVLIPKVREVREIRKDPLSRIEEELKQLRKDVDELRKKD
jgi:membrane-associated protease RseP (regulator of RpoE activity)